MLQDAIPALPARLAAPLDRLAFFLDFDGTLAPIVERPDEAALAAGADDALEALARATDGAVAVISGRSIEFLDSRIPSGLHAAAGQHGAERRDAAGNLHPLAIDPRLFAAMGDRLGEALRPYPGILVERKRFGVAVHYRLAPDAADAVRAAVEAEAAQAGPAITLQPGKMVFELKSALASKGRAVEAFMAEPPFAGRRPVAAGDDLTDEAAFAAAQNLGGLAVKIGPGETRADFRAPGVEAFVAWLAGLAGR